MKNKFFLGIEQQGTRNIRWQETRIEFKQVKCCRRLTANKTSSHWAVGWTEGDNR